MRILITGGTGYAVLTEAGTYRGLATAATGIHGRRTRHEVTVADHITDTPIALALKLHEKKG